MSVAERFRLDGRVALTAIVVVTGLYGLTACASSASHAAPTSRTTVVATTRPATRPSTTPPPTTLPQFSTQPVTTPPTPGAPCRWVQLTMSVGRQDSGAGNRYQPIILTNHSQAACTLQGYPTVSLVDNTGNAIAGAGTDEPGSTERVTLTAHGGRASFALHAAGDGDSPNCSNSKALDVWDGGKNVGTVFVSLEVCNDTFGILPYVTGTTGQG